MPFNFYAVLAATFVTLLVGFVWYSPKVLGTIWMRETGITEEKAKRSNMLKVFGLTIFYSLLLASILPTIVNHQMGALGLFNGNANDPTYIELMKTHGAVFRTFKHKGFTRFLSCSIYCASYYSH